MNPCRFEESLPEHFVPFSDFLQEASLPDRFLFAKSICSIVKIMSFHGFKHHSIDDKNTLVSMKDPYEIKFGYSEKMSSSERAASFSYASYYCAPELGTNQWKEAKIGHHASSDIFSVGVLLLELFTSIRFKDVVM